MTTPPAHRDLALLDPQFRQQFEAWLVAARAAFPQYDFGVHETLRSPERQAALYAQGRTTPGPVVTWTQRSKHQDGIAADWHLARDGVALWEPSLYERVYERVPPAAYGLRTLEGDLVHLEQATAVPLPGSARLLLVYDAAGAEVARVPLPEGADVLVRASADGRRVFVRPDSP